MQHTLHGELGSFMPWHDPSTKQVHTMPGTMPVLEEYDSDADDEEASRTNVELQHGKAMRPRQGSSLFAGGEDTAIMAERSHAVWEQHHITSSAASGIGTSQKFSKTRRADPAQINVRQPGSQDQSEEHQRRAALPAKMDDVKRLQKVERLLRKREIRNEHYLH